MPTFDSSRPDFQPYGLTCVRWTPTRMPRPDRHDEVELNLLEAGSLTYLLGGSKVEIAARRLTLFWAAIPHQILAAEGNPGYFVATVPLTWLLAWRLPEHLMQPLLHGQVLHSPDCEAFESDQRLFECWAQDLAAGGPEQRQAAELEIQARLVRLAAALAPHPASRPTATPHTVHPLESRMSKVEQMASFIARHYGEELTVADIAGSVGLHPNYAMNLFRNSFGTTVLDYVLQHRLSHTQRLLVTTDDRILDVAFASGFGSLSRFNEAFKHAFGCTPSDYRRQHRLV